MYEMYLNKLLKYIIPMNNDIDMELLMDEEFYRRNFIHVHGLDRYYVVQMDLEHHHRRKIHQQKKINRIVIQCEKKFFIDMCN